MTSGSGQPLPPEEGDAPEQPRRGASAQFSIAESAGQQAAMRHAMDPANESLAEALRLSYRVLQVAILVLVVVFFFSGFQSVSEGQTGVKAVFGRIVGEPGQEQVRPGLQPFWPYPVGEIVLVDQKRVVELRREFWPKLRPGQTTLEQAVSAASQTDQLEPALDSGSVITADGDLAHVQVVAEYTVEDAVRLLTELDADSADTFVKNALKEATIQMAAQFTLTELLEGRDQPAQVLRSLAQQSLDSVQCGIKLASVSIPQKTALLAVRKQLDAVGTARENAKSNVVKAQQEASRTLVGAAGPRYGELLDLIAQYESLLTREDVQGADQAMVRIGAFLEGGNAAGETSQIIAKAKAYESSLIARLSNEVRRLNGLTPSFRENPAQLVRQQWLDAMRVALDSKLVEVFSAPATGGPVRLSLESSQDVMQERRNREIELKKQAAMQAAANAGTFQIGTQLIQDVGKPGRKLNEQGTKAPGRD